MERREEDDRRPMSSGTGRAARTSRAREERGDEEPGRQYAQKARRAHPPTLHPRRRPGGMAYQLLPRATVTASPFNPEAASLHRKTITSATSRGVSTRPGG